ncbi:MAG: AGE family epimerase/isomerase [Clostridia bacterium]
MLAKMMRDHLVGKILPFWQALRDEQRGGFVGYVDESLTPNLDAHKGCILHSRILWSFSTAARVLKASAYLDDAEHAYRFLKQFVDEEFGGVYWSVTADGRPLDTTKHTYCQAFAIYGLAAYARATGQQEPLEQAMGLMRLLEERCRDADGYGEAYQRDFSPESNEKLSENGVLAQRTMNTLLHVIEAYTELYRATGNAQVRALVAEGLKIAQRKLFNPDKARLDVFFDNEYRSLIDMQSYGHDIEASWLLWDAAEATGEEIGTYRCMCLRLADSVLLRALTKNGLRNERVNDVNDETRVWWVQAEGVIGFLNAYQLSGEERYLRAFEQQWAYIQRAIVDPRPGGEWYWSVQPDGKPTCKPIVEEWKCPYHNSRMCLEVIGRAG